jgi:hypothetical protein
MTKASEVTNIAVFGERLAGIKETVDKTAKTVEEIKNAKYITSNEAAMMIQASEKKQSDDLQELKNDLSSIKKTLWGFGSFIILAVLGAIIKLVLKV